MRATRNVRIAGIVFAVLALAGCTDYSGDGKEFSATGVVVETGHDEIQVRIDEVEYANGGSGDDIVAGETAGIHDNYDKCDWLSDRITVAVVKDVDGNTILLKDLDEDATITFTGRERDNDDTCKHRSERRVFDTVNVVDSGSVNE